MRCISLFSGAGGLDVGAERAGVHVSVCIEFDPDAAETLRLNFASQGTNVVESDVRAIDFRKLKSGEPTIVIGGPPCQPFSKNGYWVKNDNRLIDADPRNMLAEFTRAIRQLRPTGFLFENVESILHPTNRDTFSKFLGSLERLGYACTVFRANAADFGVPQKRKRVFVFGVPRDIGTLSAPCATHGEKEDALKGILRHEGVGKFIAPFAGAEYAEPQEVASNGTYFNELLHVPAGRNYIALSKLEGYGGRTFRSGGRFWNFLQKLHPDEPSITIAAQPGPWVGPFHWESRRLRAPEIAAIQTFPIGYRFYGNRRSVQKQVGNAVPCLLGEKMVAHLLAAL